MKPQACLKVRYLHRPYAVFARILCFWALVAALCYAQDESWARAILLAQEHEGHGRFAEAEAALLDALRQAEKPGSEDLQVAVTLNNLGSLCQVLARNREAERYYKRSISVFEKASAPTDPGVAWPLVNLAFVYIIDGQYAKAEQIGRRVSTLPIELLGHFQPQVRARLLQVEGAAHGHRGDYSQAQALQQQALKILQENFGPKHSEVALAWSNLGFLCMENRLYTEALSHFQQATAIWQETSDPRHPAFITALTNMARLYYHLGFLPEAEARFHRALRMAEHVFGPRHLQVGIILSEYAVVLREEKRKSAAKRFQKRADAILARQEPDDLTRHTVDIHTLLKEAKRQKAKP